MPELPTIETGRLVLRPWRDADRAPFAALNADPVVREFFPGLLTRAQSDAMIDGLMADAESDGISFAAVERKGGGFLGMCGLARVDFEMPLAPCVEIGWRFARHVWGKGYAAEAARGWLDHGFGTLVLAGIVAFTVPGNARSLGVMARIGMSPEPAADFDHPNLAPGSRLRRMAVWRIARESWAGNRA